MRNKYGIFILIAVLCLYLCGCQPAGDKSAAQLLNESGLESADSVSAIETEYTAEGRQSNTFYCDTMRAGSCQEFLQLCEALFNAQPKSMGPNYYYNVADASHTLLVKGENQAQCKIYYDEANQFFCVVEDLATAEGEPQLIYHYFEAPQEIAQIFQARRAFASDVQASATSQETEKLLLKASITKEELTAEGEEVEYSYFDEASTDTLQGEDAQYRVIYPEETQSVPIDQLLVQVTCGKQEQPGYTIDFEGIIRTDKMVVIHVSTEAPADHAEIPEDAPLMPVRSILIKASDIPAGHIVVFADADNNVLEAFNWQG